MHLPSRSYVLREVRIICLKQIILRCLTTYSLPTIFHCGLHEIQMLWNDSQSIHDLAALPTPLPSLSVTLPYAHYVLAKWNVGLLKYWYFFFPALFIIFVTVYNVYFPFIQAIPFHFSKCNLLYLLVLYMPSTSVVRILFTIGLILSVKDYFLKGK